MYIQKGNESDIILPCHCEEQRGLRRGNLAERNAPDGWIPTVTSFPRNDKGGTPTPDCHVERSRNISWKGNDVNYRKIVCLLGAPDGWIPTVTSFPRNDKGGTPTPDCHVERSRNISWKGNDVNYRKIVCLLGAPDGWIPTVTSFPRNDKGGTPTPERILFQGVLINGMCNFEDGTRAARRREYERRA